MRFLPQPGAKSKFHSPPKKSASFNESSSQSNEKQKEQGMKTVPSLGLKKEASPRFAVWQKRSASMDDADEDDNTSSSKEVSSTNAETKSITFRFRESEIASSVAGRNSALTRAASPRNPSTSPSTRTGGISATTIERGGSKEPSPMSSFHRKGESPVSKSSATQKGSSQQPSFSVPRRSQSGDVIPSSSAKAVSKPSWISRKQDKKTVTESQLSKKISPKSVAPARFRQFLLASEKNVSSDGGKQLYTAAKANVSRKSTDDVLEKKNNFPTKGPSPSSTPQEIAFARNPAFLKVDAKLESELSNEEPDMDSLDEALEPSKLEFASIEKASVEAQLKEGQDIEEAEISNENSVKLSESAFAGARRIISLDVDIDDDDWQWKLFPEPASIEYTPEFDHVAVEIYKSEDVEQEEKASPERPPGISGYGFDRIFEEEQEPPAPPSADGMFGDYLEKRRKLLRWEEHLKKRGRVIVGMQALVRRFLARLEYHEKARSSFLCSCFKEHLKKRGRVIVGMQALVRRFLARLEYHEKARSRDLKRKRNRICEIETYLFAIGDETRREIAEMKLSNTQTRESEREKSLQASKKKEYCRWPKLAKWQLSGQKYTRSRKR